MAGKIFLNNFELFLELSPAGTETELIIADAYNHEKSEATSLEVSLMEQQQSTSEPEATSETEASLEEQDVDDALSNSADSTLVATNHSSSTKFNVIMLVLFVF